MATHPPTNLAGRFLDVVFGKKLEGEEAARARGEGLPSWARRIYGVLLWSSFLGAVALFMWSKGWLPFVDTKIDSVWALAALGLNALLRSECEWITRRHDRRAKAGRAMKAPSLQ